ncbi:mu-like prophage FluMu tail sheath protein [Ylistrum balloti]|uniref:mu-like prophage FluMu tail sheath protein n=1 Tax=Ylistrum balloti TaxID=509963 RepID=UPI00290599D1|nr:mu-like prophage FluMu tail sheath protein [Ylistrum balloti]
MTTITFDTLSANILRPGVLQEIAESATQIETGNRPNRVLLVGYRSSNGSVAALTPRKPTRISQAQDYFGATSMLAKKFAAFWEIHQRFKVTCIAVDEPSSGTKATKTLTFTGTATEAGIIHLYIDGIYVPVSVASGDAAADVATAVQTALAARTDLQMTSSVSSGVVTLSANHKGVHGNHHDVRVNYRQDEDNQTLPAGISLAIADGTAGSGVIDITTITAVMGDSPYELIVQPFSDSQALSDWEEELQRRWGDDENLNSVMMVPVFGTHSANTTLAEGLNTQFICPLSLPSNIPATPWEVAARVGAIETNVNDIEVGRPCQRQVVPNTLVPNEEHRFTGAEREAQLQAGLSTFYVDDFGKLRIERLRATYKRNSAGEDDYRFRDFVVMRMLQAMRYDWQRRIHLKFADWKFASDNNAGGPGKRVVTPNVLKAEALFQFDDWFDEVLVQDRDQYKKDLRAIALSDTQAAMILPPHLIGQFRQVLTRVQPIVK